MNEREMYIVGNEDGEARIQCRRKGCLTPAGFWFEITLPYDATPAVVDRLWHQHRLDHANKER